MELILLVTLLATGTFVALLALYFLAFCIVYYIMPDWISAACAVISGIAVGWALSAAFGPWIAVVVIAIGHAVSARSAEILVHTATVQSNEDAVLTAFHTNVVSEN